MLLQKWRNKNGIFQRYQKLHINYEYFSISLIYRDILEEMKVTYHLDPSDSE